MNPEPSQEASVAISAEPRAARAATPAVVMFVLLALAAYGSTYYLEQHSGGFKAQVAQPYPSVAFLKKYPPYGAADDPISAGKRVYETYCQICHQSTGLGLPGQFPPLAGSEWVVEGKPDRIIRIVLNGLSGPIEVKGVTYNGAMFAFKDMPLKDEDIANVLTYIRNTWGNKAPEVKPELVKAIRGEVSSRGLPWTSAELLKVPVE